MRASIAAFLRWLASKIGFCQHDFAPSMTTYAPPYEGYISFTLSDAVRERTMLGVTTVLSRCAKCGELRRKEMLGAKVQPPSQGKLIAMRREERF